MSSNDEATHFYPTTNWIPNKVLSDAFSVTSYSNRYLFSFRRFWCSKFDCIFTNGARSLDREVLPQFWQTRCHFRPNRGWGVRKWHFWNSKLTSCYMSFLLQLFLKDKLGYQPEFQPFMTTLFRPEAHSSKWVFSSWPRSEILKVWVASSYFVWHTQLLCVKCCIHMHFCVLLAGHENATIINVPNKRGSNFC